MTVRRQVVLRPLEPGDLPALRALTPPDWSAQLDVHLFALLGNPGFGARVATRENRIVGVGHWLRHGPVAWLGNIVVAADQRRQGLGTRITTALMESLARAGCRSIVLVSTEQGLPIYEKLGFRVESAYLIFGPPETLSPAGLPPAAYPPTVLPLPEQRAGDLLALDRAATGEDRAALLHPHMAAASVFFGPTGAMDGFCLPTLGVGPVVAATADAGRALLAARQQLFPERGPIVPEANGAAIDLCRSGGCLELRRRPRLQWGEAVDWAPTQVWARGAGYFG